MGAKDALIPNQKSKITGGSNDPPPASVKLFSGLYSGMNQPADTVGKEHINFSRLNDCCNFSWSPHGMDHDLPSAIGARHVIRLTLDRLGPGSGQLGAA